MNVKINDKTYVFAGGTTLHDALILAGIATAGIATAVNDNVVPASERKEWKLNEGDRVLIIKAFYGG